MSLDRRRFLCFTSTAAVAGAIPFDLRAQSYPIRAVRVIVPFAPGGPADLVGRLVAQGLSEHFGKQFYVENVGGAGGNIGTGQVARAAPDGHALLVAAPSYAVNPSLFDKVPYDPQRDFTAVTFIATAPTALTVHPSIPARTVKELVDFIKTGSVKLSFASPGPGTPPHLLGELFRRAFDLDLVHAPFNSGGQAIASTIAAHTPISFGALPPAIPHIKEGKLRALAITSTGRSRALPDVPTMAEAGYPDIAADIWNAVLVPAGTPYEIVSQLQRAIATVIAQPEVKDRLAGLGLIPVGNSPQECDAQIRAEIMKWAKVVRDAGIKLP